MHLQQLQEQIESLSIEEKIILMNNIALSLKDKNKVKRSKQDAVKQMKGFLKNNVEILSDLEVETTLREHKENKYL